MGEDPDGGPCHRRCAEPRGRGRCLRQGPGAAGHSQGGVASQKYFKYMQYAAYSMILMPLGIMPGGLSLAVEHEK